MPKEKKTLLNRLRCYVDEFGSIFLKLIRVFYFVKFVKQK